MATLVFLNGPPASGKSTLAAAYAARRPLTLGLDVDVVRGLLGDWRSEAAEIVTETGGTHALDGDVDGTLDALESAIEAAIPPRSS